MELRLMMGRAAEATVEVVRNIEPGRLGAPTPCPEYDVRALVNHQIEWVGARAEAAARKRPIEDTGEEHDLTREPDWAGRYASQVGSAADAWSDPAAWEGTTSLSGDRQMPASFVGGILFGELLLHGWDLAAATGQELKLDDDVVAALYEKVAATADQARQYNVFGPEVVVPESAPLFHRALGLSGRDPHWSV